MALNPSRRGFAVARRRLSLHRGQGEKAGFEGGWQVCNSPIMNQRLTGDSASVNA